MGVFTVGRQVALEIDMPGWWLANASVDMDFRRGLYYDSSTANPRAATDFLSCIRASIGYAKTNAGTLTSFASNALRITDLGMLVEDARTNYATNSQIVTSWTVISSGTLADNVTTSPDGTSTAGSITENNTISDNYGIRNNFSVGAAGNYTLSIFVKKVDLRYVQINHNSASGGSVSAFYDLDTGAIIAGGGSPVATSMESFGSSGWWRISITAPLNLSENLNAYVLPTDSSSSSAHTGVVGRKTYMWGMQTEPGNFPSSYIPTTGAAATRAAENITTSGSLQTAINNATGSFVAQVDNGLVASVAANIVDSNGTNLLGFDASNHALASMIGTLTTGNTANRTTQDKLGLAWNASGRSLVLNGGTVATDASAQTPSATQHIGSSGTANFAYAYFERMSAWTTKLADATLQGFTV